MKAARFQIFVVAVFVVASSMLLAADAQPGAPNLEDLLNAAPPPGQKGEPVLDEPLATIMRQFKEQQKRQEQERKKQEGPPPKGRFPDRPDFLPFASVDTYPLHPSFHQSPGHVRKHKESKFQQYSDILQPQTVAQLQNVLRQVSEAAVLFYRPWDSHLEPYMAALNRTSHPLTPCGGYVDNFPDYVVATEDPYRCCSCGGGNITTMLPRKTNDVSVDPDGTVRNSAGEEELVSVLDPSLCAFGPSRGSVSQAHREWQDRETKLKIPRENRLLMLSAEVDWCDASAAARVKATQARRSEAGFPGASQIKGQWFPSIVEARMIQANEEQAEAESMELEDEFGRRIKKKTKVPLFRKLAVDVTKLGAHQLAQVSLPEGNLIQRLPTPFVMYAKNAVMLRTPAEDHHHLNEYFATQTGHNLMVRSMYQLHSILQRHEEVAVMFLLAKERDQKEKKTAAGECSLESHRGPCNSGSGDSNANTNTATATTEEAAGEEQQSRFVRSLIGDFVGATLRMPTTRNDLPPKLPLVVVDEAALMEEHEARRDLQTSYDEQGQPFLDQEEIPLSFDLLFNTYIAHESQTVTRPVDAPHAWTNPMTQELHLMDVVDPERRSSLPPLRLAVLRKTYDGDEIDLGLHQAVHMDPRFLCHEAGWLWSTESTLGDEDFDEVPPGAGLVHQDPSVPPQQQAGAGAPPVALTKRQQADEYHRGWIRLAYPNLVGWLRQSSGHSYIHEVTPKNFQQLWEDTVVFAKGTVYPGCSAKEVELKERLRRQKSKLARRSSQENEGQPQQQRRGGGSGDSSYTLSRDGDLETMTFGGQQEGEEEIGDENPYVATLNGGLGGKPLNGMVTETGAQQAVQLSSADINEENPADSGGPIPNPTIDDKTSIWESAFMDPRSEKTTNPLTGCHTKAGAALILLETKNAALGGDNDAARKITRESPCQGQLRHFSTLYRSDIFAAADEARSPVSFMSLRVDRYPLFAQEVVKQLHDLDPTVPFSLEHLAPSVFNNKKQKERGSAHQGNDASASASACHFIYVDTAHPEISTTGARGPEQPDTIHPLQGLGFSRYGEMTTESSVPFGVTLTPVSTDSGAYVHRQDLDDILSVQLNKGRRMNALSVQFAKAKDDGSAEIPVSSVFPHPTLWEWYECSQHFDSEHFFTVPSSSFLDQLCRSPPQDAGDGSTSSTGVNRRGEKQFATDAADCITTPDKIPLHLIGQPGAASVYVSQQALLGDAMNDLRGSAPTMDPLGDNKEKKKKAVARTWDNLIFESPSACSVENDKYRAQVDHRNINLPNLDPEFHAPNRGPGGIFHRADQKMVEYADSLLLVVHDGESCTLCSGLLHTVLPMLRSLGTLKGVVDIQTHDLSERTTNSSSWSQLPAPIQDLVTGAPTILLFRHSVNKVEKRPDVVLYRGVDWSVEGILGFTLSYIDTVVDPSVTLEFKISNLHHATGARTKSETLSDGVVEEVERMTATAHHAQDTETLRVMANQPSRVETEFNKEAKNQVIKRERERTAALLNAEIVEAKKQKREEEKRVKEEKKEAHRRAREMAAFRKEEQRKADEEAAELEARAGRTTAARQASLEEATLREKQHQEEMARRKEQEEKETQFAAELSHKAHLAAEEKLALEREQAKEKEAKLKKWQDEKIALMKNRRDRATEEARLEMAQRVKGEQHAAAAKLAEEALSRKEKAPPPPPQVDPAEEQRRIRVRALVEEKIAEAEGIKSQGESLEDLQHEAEAKLTIADNILEMLAAIHQQQPGQTAVSGEDKKDQLIMKTVTEIRSVAMGNLAEFAKLKALRDQNNIRKKDAPPRDKTEEAPSGEAADSTEETVPDDVKPALGEIETLAAVDESFPLSEIVSDEIHSHPQDKTAPPPEVPIESILEDWEGHGEPIEDGATAVDEIVDVEGEGIPEDEEGGGFENPENM